MAEVDVCPRTQILKNSKILVNVEEALQDILVVTYAFETKLFQGVLLDATKRDLPCGITMPPSHGDDDRFYSISQRFTYFQEKNGSFHFKKTFRPQARYKNSRMTVRLRPRQVLCSKCRSICNENSENVDHSKQGKSSEKVSPCPSDRRLRSAGTSPRPLFSENHSDNQPVLIPKLSRLNPSEISALSGSGTKLNFSDWVKCNRDVPDGNLKDSGIKKPNSENTGVFSVSVEQGSEQDDDSDMLEDEGKGMVLRKKRSVGSMEDLWDESVFEDNLKKTSINSARTTPVIKISFGSQGEGTVLKIPSKVQDYIQSESEAEDIQKSKEAESRAAKKALKRAKKEARRKLMASSSKISPIRSLTAGTSPPYDIMYRRHHKRKLKHKKKHKEERRHSRTESEVDEGTNSDNKLCWNILQPRDNYSAIKEQCLKQKLSINLKRLNANAYCLGSNGSKSPGSVSSCSNSEFSDDHGEAVPDFPSSHPLMIRLKSDPGIKSESVQSCLTPDGRHITVGDIVWGKIHGFPWWPGKILSITSRSNGSGSMDAQAHVAWYGSSTSSLMPCDQLSPFLETFKTRFNKKKRGPYKEAIRQATLEATTAMQMNILS